MTNLGLPSSSILGKEGGGVFWNWRACIPLLPFASTTNTRFCLCWGFWVIVLEENSECFTNTSSCVLEFDKGSRTSAFRDMLASIFCSLHSQFLRVSLFNGVLFVLRGGWGDNSSTVSEDSYPHALRDVSGNGVRHTEHYHSFTWHMIRPQLLYSPIRDHVFGALPHSHRSWMCDL